MSNSTEGSEGVREDPENKEFLLNRRMNRRKAIGTTAGVAGIVVGVVVGSAAGYFAGASTAPVGATQTVTATTTVGGAGQTVTNTQTVTAAVQAKISGEVLLGHIGSLSTWGQAKLDEIAFFEAIKDFNAYLNSLKAGFTLKGLSEDTAGDAAVALQKVQSLQAQGVKVFVGPDSSGQVRNIKAYADSNKIIIFSESSTDDRLAIEDDFVFRGVTKNSFQGQALVGAWQSLGYKFVGMLTNAQAGHQDLANIIEQSMQNAGIQSFRIDYSPDLKEFTSEVATLDSKVGDAINTYGVDKVAVYIGAFDESAIQLKSAASSSNLPKVLWWGSDATALSDTLLKDAGAEASQVKFLCTIFGASDSPQKDSIQQRLKQAAGQDIGAYGLVSYDVVWLLGQTMLHAQSSDPSAIQQFLIPVSERTFGATGWMALNETGDRGYGAQDFWGVREDPPGSGKFVWYKAGIWDAASGATTWVIPPQ